MKEEKERLLKYIGEIFEKRRLEKIRSGEASDKDGKDNSELYAGFREDLVRAGKRIRKIREGKKMSIAELAALTGLTQSYIQEIEVGVADPYMTEIYEITKALDIELSSLFEH